MDHNLEEHRFYIPYTYPQFDKHEVLTSGTLDYKDWVIGDVRPEYTDALHLKLEEYILRIQSGVKPDKVLDAICKTAIVDILLREGSVEYSEAFSWAAEGCRLYGVSLFSDVLDGQDDEAINYIFDNFFKRAFRTIQLYAESGNEFVAGGNQLFGV
jgi:hypothetical protein